MEEEDQSSRERYQCYTTSSRETNSNTKKSYKYSTSIHWNWQPWYHHYLENRRYEKNVDFRGWKYLSNAMKTYKHKKFKTNLCISNQMIIRSRQSSSTKRHDRELVLKKKICRDTIYFTCESLLKFLLSKVCDWYIIMCTILKVINIIWLEDECPSIHTVDGTIPKNNSMIWSRLVWQLQIISNIA